MSYSLDERLEILGIGSEQVGHLKNLEFKVMYIEEDKLDNMRLEEMIIELSDLVGISRPNADGLNSWIDALGYLHKMRNFNIYTHTKFKSIIMNPTELSGVPEVIECDGKFYIAGEGKHRLTIAKCLQLKEAKVIVRYINNIES